MKTKNTIICDNCEQENWLYKSTCKECGHYLRSTVVNINLWETIWNLFENPTNTIKNIVYAEHKNFVLFLAVLFSIKACLVVFTLSFAFNINTKITFSEKNVLLSTLASLVIILIVTKITTSIFNAPNKRTRYKDNLALTVYSFIPTIFTLVFLTPIEYGIFGINWFDYNPSPIIIKEGTAYVYLAIEAIMLIWSLFLLVKSYYIQTESILKPVVCVLLFLFTLFLTINYLPYSLL